MSTSKIKDVLTRVYSAQRPAAADLEFLLSLATEPETRILYAYADQVRKKFAGNGIFLRGIIEFDNNCRNTCLYCGLNRKNTKIRRYHLNQSQVLESVAHMAAQGIKTVVLQSGEAGDLDAVWLAAVIRETKQRYHLAVTLSVGEQDLRSYRLWRAAGADRYLLKIETTDRKIYRSLHPEMDYDRRVNCLRNLKKLGYQVGSGIIVGLRGQTKLSIARDILFFKRHEFDMIGIGPFIPHHQTRLAGDKKGEALLTLNALALTRIVTRYSHLPATTALGSLEKDYRITGLQAGANVLMPNFTPQPYRRYYELYPGKRCVN
ncbi:MAG: [FeFe] hydrogenase H-cluster radical SAM maturase HydE, partial [bacterium]|nr:[FeFe] hydrogenase H-cluster radical SAM maturase HydE [bacterium]